MKSEQVSDDGEEFLLHSTYDTLPKSQSEPPHKNTQPKCMDQIRESCNTAILGVVYAALSGLCFTMSNFMVQVAVLEIRESTAKEVSSLQMVFVRCVVQLFFVIPFIFVFKLSFYKNAKDFIYIVPMGMSGFVNIVFIYLSLQRIPISDTLLITFTSPFFCAVYSKIFLNESLHWINALAGVLSFVGVTMVARPSFLFGTQKERTTLVKTTNSSTSEMVYLDGVVYAILGALCLALYFVLVRRLIRKDELHPMFAVFYPSLFGTICICLLMFVKQDNIYYPQHAQDFFEMTSIGVYSIIALCFLTLALKYHSEFDTKFGCRLCVLVAILGFQYCTQLLEREWWGCDNHCY